VITQATSRIISACPCPGGRAPPALAA
jgi:hypothetical protein